MSTITSQEYIQAWKKYHDSWQAVNNLGIEDSTVGDKHKEALKSQTDLSEACNRWSESRQTLSTSDQSRVNSYSLVGELVRDKFNARLDAAE